VPSMLTDRVSSPVFSFLFLPHHDDRLSAYGRAEALLLADSVRHDLDQSIGPTIGTKKLRKRRLFLEWSHRGID
jgi:hypothetical protein